MHRFRVTQSSSRMVVNSMKLPDYCSVKEAAEQLLGFHSFTSGSRAAIRCFQCNYTPSKEALKCRSPSKKFPDRCKIVLTWEPGTHRGIPGNCMVDELVKKDIIPTTINSAHVHGKAQTKAKLAFTKMANTRWLSEDSCNEIKQFWFFRSRDLILLDRFTINSTTGILTGHG